METEKNKKKAYISRHLATQHIRDLIERVRVMNETDDKYKYPHKIKTLILFGSYLSEKNILGDIDLFFEEKRRWGNNTQEETEYFFNVRRNAGIMSMFNSSYFTMKILRNNKKSFSFHDMYEFDELKKSADFKFKYLIKDFEIQQFE